MSFAGFKRIIEEGDTIILYVNLSQIYAIEVKPSVKNKHGKMVEYTFQSKYGALRVMDLVGKEFGSKIQLTRGYAYVLYPTPELWTLTLPHRTQILYTPDISLILMELDIKPRSIVCEAGTGSGSLSHAILRSIGPKGHLYTCDFHQERVEVARNEFDHHGLSSRVTVESRDVCADGWGRTNIAHAVFLDLPKPWEALNHAVNAIHPNGGRICSFSPCVEQVNKSCEVMREIGLTEINTVECLQREFQLKSMVLPSVSFKKVEEPNFERENSKIIEPEKKKLKLDPLSGQTESSDVENENTLNSEINEASNTGSKEESYEETLFKDYKIRTAMPLLKMQGHTGFLTFATVSAKLKHKLSRTKTLSVLKNTSNKMENNSDL
ncbi:UNVERIFIED_CONTAM: hypothetical protein RMT77_000446 [Armadillidium vulgare]